MSADWWIWLRHPHGTTLNGRKSGKQIIGDRLSHCLDQSKCPLLNNRPTTLVHIRIVDRMLKTITPPSWPQIKLHRHINHELLTEDIFFGKHSMIAIKLHLSHIDFIDGRSPLSQASHPSFSPCGRSAIHRERGRYSPLSRYQDKQ